MNSSDPTTGEQAPTAELAPRPSADADSPSDAATRGRLDIRDRVIEKVVAHAAAEVPGAGGSVHRVLGQALGSADPDARPRAKVTVAGDLVTAEVAMSVPWPESINDVAASVRDRIALRLDRMTGMRLGHVDISVTALPLRASRRRVA